MFPTRLLDCRGPRTVLAQRYSGLWTSRLDGSDVPDEPIAFRCVDRGQLSPAISTWEGVLVRPDLAEALDRAGAHPFHAFPTVLSRGTGAVLSRSYFLVRAPIRLPVPDLSPLPRGNIFTVTCGNSRYLSLSLAASDRPMNQHIQGPTFDRSRFPYRCAV